MMIFTNSRIKNLKIFITGLFAISLVLMILSLGIGYYGMHMGDVIRTLLGKPADPNHWTILSIRMPRIIGAYLIGAALSVSGAAYQGVLKNPLASPDILGVASGAGMGAAAAIVLGLNSLYIQLFAFAAGITAVIIACHVGSNVKYDNRVSLVLAGTLVGSLSFSITSLLKYIADTENQLPEITYWLMGSLSKVNARALYFALPFMGVGFILLFAMRWRLNILTLSDVEAGSMGIDVKKSMAGVVVGSTMLCSAAVCLGGLIGWVGLMIPHIARALAGPQYIKLLPVAAMLGGIFLLLMDNIVRSVSVMEIPIGLAISFIGAPFFYMLIKKGKKN